MLGVGREPLKLPCPGQVRGPSPRLPGHCAGSRGVRLTPARFYKPGLRSRHTHTHTRAGAPSRVYTCTHQTPHTRVYTPAHTEHQTHTHTCACTPNATHTYACMCVHLCTHHTPPTHTVLTTHSPHTHTCIHTRTHHTHTHVRTHLHTPNTTHTTHTCTPPPTRIAGSLSAWMPCTLWTPSPGSPRPLTSVTGGERGRLPVLCVRLSGQRGTALRAVSGMQRGTVVVAGVVTQDLPTPLGCPLARPE